MRWLWLLLAFSLSTACGNEVEGTPERASGVDIRAEDLVGCYSIRVAAWDPPLTRDVDFYRLPEIAELRLESSGLPGRRGDDRLLLPAMVTPVVLRGERALQPGSWTLQSPDSLMLLWTDGYTGVEMAAAVTTADSTVATAMVIHDDQRGPPPRSQVMLRSVPCG